MAYTSNIPIGSVAYSSLGTNTTDVAGQFWISDIFIPAPQVITVIGFLQGGTATTDNVLACIWDNGGNLLANSNTAGVTLSGANTFAERTLLSSVRLAGNAWYFVGIQGNGTAAGAIRTIAASTFPGVRANSLAGSFGTIPSVITVPTSFNADKGPVVYVY